MAQDNQNEFPLNTGLESQITRQTARHLPSFFRTDSNKKFLGGTLDPLTQPGKLTRINSYIGRHDILNYDFNDNYLEENTNSRQYYQLEPSFVHDDPVSGKVKWYADYIDYINNLKYFGTFTGNHSNLNGSEAYAWDPNIDWDKFVNYREYYWLPNGPDPITIYGETESIVSTYSVTGRLDNDNSTYVFSPDGLTANPILTLYRGQTYKFDITAIGYPFCIKTRPETGPSYFYNNGISNQLVEKGIMEFTVPYEAPSVLYYLNNKDVNSVGIIEIKDIKDATFLDIDLTLLGKKNFTSASGIEFINGLKIKFAGNVTPEIYATGTWYVEGVGDKIKLINSKNLDNPVTYGETLDIPFDNQPFDSLPWEVAENYSTTRDYIVINRASRDRNSWSRNNRWFHINVINTTAKVNKQTALFDQTERAVRPIIEFAPNMKLFNNGWISKQDVDLVDTTTTDIFSIIEGSTSYHIDEELIYPGYRILFLADTDDLVVGRIFTVTQIFNANAPVSNNKEKTQISLQIVDDSEPLEGQVVYVKKGTLKGKSYHYQDGSWKAAQEKKKVNQAPLFDLFDENYNSFSDNTYYPFNTFTGNKFFSYLTGKGTKDSELGFSLSYHSIDNVGDIQFSFDLQKQLWTYQENNTLKTLQSYTGFVRKLNDNDTFSYTNGWTRTYKDLEQPVVRVLRIDTATDLIPIDVYDNSGSIKGLSVRVYVNNKKVDPTTISFENIEGYYYIKFSSQLSVDDKVVYKVKSKTNKNARGYYEIPHNWQNNPLNDPIDTFTFGEVIDHVSTIIDNIISFNGKFPGISNLGNLGIISHYGERFLQHSSSMPVSTFVLTDKHANIVKALRYTSTKYTAFKKEFIRLATTTAFSGTVAEIVDSILERYSSAKFLDQSAFYYSDMAPAGAATSIRNYTVVDPRLPVFVIDSIFKPMTTSKRVILVYLNDVQLIYGIDYNFETTDAFVNILTALKIGDKITIKDYSNTDGRTYIPYTPSKLGLFPSYIPRIYIDDTYTTPTKVIEGHDGSITLAYNDYRDELVLELEKRIFNCRKVEYDPLMFNIDDIMGGYYRKTNFTKEEINQLLVVDFLRWNSVADQDLSSNYYYIDENTFTYNYNNSIDPGGTELLYGYWRAIYKYFFDTDRPHICPWEMLGFAIKPSWWDKIYGEAPYTSENRILWDHLERGLIADPSYPRINKRYIRPGLSYYIPVDSDGNLLSPLDSNLALRFSLINAKGDYIFGDQAPVETAWRRSSEYPYSVISALCLLRGAEFIGKMWDRFTIKRNIAGQVYSTVTGFRVQAKNLTFPNVPLGNPNSPTTPVSVTSGLVNFIEEYLFDAKYVNIDLYKENLKSLDAKLAYRIGGYTSKEHINILLDSRSPNATGTVFLPAENYKVFYNKSSPVATVSYSGVIVEKVGTSYPQWISGHRYTVGTRVLFQGEVYHCLVTHVSRSDSGSDSVQQFNLDIGYWGKEAIQKVGYKVRGYDNEKNYFEIFGYRPTQNDPSINVGGITESYSEWEPSKYYVKGQIIKFANSAYYRSIINHTSSSTFDLDIKKWAPLSTLPIVGGATAIRRTRFGTTPIFIYYGTVFSTIQEVVDFLLGYQRRLEVWGFSFNDYNKDLNVPLTWLTSAKEFMFWTLQNWAAGSVITLSPSASMIQFTPIISASVDNTNSDFYDYSIFKADGTPLKSNLTDTYREGSGFVIKPSTGSTDGIFHIRANLVYKEHVLLFDNVSIFNDVIYDKIPGYRQGRLKLIGYKTMNWDGSYTSPGFMYDAAEINDWEPNTDYMIGDTVKYKNYYFTAPTNILNKVDFNYNDWKKLDSAPVAGLIPNFDYKAEQFRDFYSLDASMFDSTQEKLARHLIGYQPRQYLANIINDDVAQYKFYQGFIKEKGTLNSISKLFDALRASGQSNIDIKEEWAFKIGEYGASDAYAEIEFPLDEQKFLHNPQNINLTQNSKDFNDLSIYNIIASDVSIKPSNYNSSPFKTMPIDTTQNNYGVFKYQVAGYVRDEDVDHIIFNEAALLNYDITLFKEKDKIWLGYTSTNDWNVYEYINTNIIIKGWSVVDNIISLKCNVIPDVNVNDIVVISNLDSINGSYKVQNVYNNIIDIFTFNSTIFTIQDNLTSGIIHLLKSSRYATLDAVSSNRYNNKNILGERIWADTDAANNWLVLENQDAFSKSEVIPYSKVNNQNYGYKVKISNDSKWMIVSSPDNSSGIVTVFNRSSTTSSWNFAQTLLLPSTYISTVTGLEKFGTSLDITSDGSAIVVGCTDVSNLNMTASPHSINIGTEIVYNHSRITNQGIAVVFAYNPYHVRYELDVIIASYEPFNGEKFGSNVKISNDGTNLWLFVSSRTSSSDSNLGQVQIFKKSLTKISGLTGTINTSTDNTIISDLPSTSQLSVGMTLVKTDGSARFGGTARIASIIDNKSILIISETANKSGDITFTASSLYWTSNVQQKLDFTHHLGSSVPTLTAGGNYGYALDCTDGALRVAVSAPFAGAGEVYIFERNQNIFNLVEIINSTTMNTGIIPNTENFNIHLYNNDLFGYSLAITDRSLFVSSPNDDTKGFNVGSVYVFAKTNGTTSNVSAGSFRINQKYTITKIGNTDFTLIGASSNNVGLIFIATGIGSGNGTATILDLNSLYKLEQHILPPIVNVNDRFGTNLSINAANNVLAISAQNGNSLVPVTFDNYSDRVASDDVIIPDITGTISSRSINSTITGITSTEKKKLFIGMTLVKTSGNGKFGGIVKIKNINSDYSQITIDSELANTTGSITFTASGTHYSYALNPTSTKITGTTFDADSTLFYDKIKFTGAVYVYNRFDDNFIYGDRLRPIDDLVSDDNFGQSISVTDSTIAVGTPHRHFGNGKIHGTVFMFDYTKLSWNIIRSQNSVIDIDKFKKAFIYNTEKNTLIENLDFYDPAKGRIPSIVEQELKYQTYYDPAVYQYGVPSEVSVDESTPWTDEHIGELWWNLSTVKFTWYEQGDSTYRNNNWGRIFTGCTVDIYEWVETTYLPSKWAEMADTEAGLALGISGIPKDIDNFTWSSKFKYDPISGTKTTLYYYWVKYKKTIPNIPTRNLSCANITNLILDPRSQGYRYVFITSESTYSLANIRNRLIDKDVSLNLQFYEVDNTELLTHNEYVLIAKDDPTAIIPPVMETKWFDSLIGSNILGQSLPDLKLNKNQRYGNLNRPRQSWFINRFEALKQLFEYVNSVLTNVQSPIVDDINFSNLMKNDPEPSLNSGDIDKIIDVAYELKFIGTFRLKTAKLSLLASSIQDGKIKNVSITDPGYGYGCNRIYAINDFGDPISWYGPHVKINGTGTGAYVQTVIDNQGRVIDAIVVKSGSRYDKSTKFVVRDYTVLIRNDEVSNNAWSVQSWDKIEKEWVRVRTQAYDVTRYWSYKDWYAKGYGLSSNISYEVDKTVDLNGLPSLIGDVVKINSVGYNGNWLLLERTDTTYSSDFTSDYKVVGRQNGTIEFSDKLYNVNQDLGFDINYSFDTSFYDQSSAIEMRIILETLRDVIFINDLRIEYIKTFFNSVYYLLNEQLYTDWCFKSSFLKANHKVGSLKQRITFQSDEIASYESFIEEAKPYKTKVREWVSSYEYIEETDYITTDFDLPSYFNNDPKSQKIEVTNLLSPNIDQYPWKSWLDHHTYQISDIVLMDGGKHYTTKPMVIIYGGGGTGAKASAYISNGSVYKIVIDDPGYGFTSAPVIFISGGNGNVDAYRAKAYAIIGNGLVRTNYIGMKFDRYTNSYVVDSFKHTDYFTGKGNKTSFKLTFAPETEKNKFIIFVDNVRYYGSQFSVSVVEAEHDTYTALEGSVIFAQAPITGANIEITYDKSIRLYAAADRIRYAYNPKVGQYGKDLAQLMTGIDYGGVTVTSIDFEIGGGWDVLAWDVTSWDNVLSSNDDYVVMVSGHEIFVPTSVTGATSYPGYSTGWVLKQTMQTELISAGWKVIVPGYDRPFSITNSGHNNLFNGWFVDVSPESVNNLSFPQIFRSPDFTRSFTLPYIPLPDEIINVYLNNIRIDDNSYFGSFVGNGVDNVITIPIDIKLNDKDILTFRKSTSDGSVLPSDRSLIDSLVSGGKFSYSSATGVNPEDIIIDGDGLVTSDTSHGPEELVQGQVFDTLNINVYDAPTSGGPNVCVNNYLADGITNRYMITQIPGTSDGIIVSVNGIFVGFDVDYNSKTVILNNTPIKSSNIVIITFDTAGYDILDKEVIVSDGLTTEFLTAARYSKDKITVFVTINGLEVGATIKSSTRIHGAVGNVLIQLDTVPSIDSVIQIVVISGDIQKYSKVTNENITIVPSQLTYTLSTIPAVKGPTSANVFVIVDGEYLAAPNYENFVYDGNNLMIGDPRFLPFTLSQADINLYLNGIQLTPIRDFILDTAQNTIRLTSGVATIGDEIILEILKGNDYFISDDQLVLSGSFNTVNKNTMTITTFTNHDIVKNKRTNKGFTFSTGYDRLGYDSEIYDVLSSAFNTSGIFNLPRSVSTTSGIFVILSHKLLLPNIDYVVLDNKNQIKVKLPDTLTGKDYIEIITMNDQTVRPSIGFKIFKDMLNRNSYKALDNKNITTLAKDLSIYDTSITVTDAESLSAVNNNKTSGNRMPGVIEINGERIEYFVKNNNVLSQLRRGTLGTSVNINAIAGTKVYDVGAKLNIPYTDNEIKRTSYGDGLTQVFDFDSVPVKTNHDAWYRHTIPSNFGQCDTIEVYVAGRRLVKTPTYVYDQSLGQDSYNKDPITNKIQGDKHIEAEFSVDGVNKSVRLTVPPLAGELVLIVAKQGKTWQNPSENLPLIRSKSDIARFLNTKQVDLPK